MKPVLSSGIQTGTTQAAARAPVARADAGPVDSFAPADPKEWTVLVFLDGRNRLAYSSRMALDELKAVGSNADVNLVAQATIQPTLNERIRERMGSTPTRRYLVQRGDAAVVQDLGDKQPLTQDALADFLTWGVKNFPAKHYMLVVKKHGLGFAKSEPSTPLSARELGQALAQTETDTGRKMDVVSFDSCSMQQMEVACELQGHASVMTGSEEDVFAVDYPYEKIALDLERNAKTAGAVDAGRIIVEAHRERAPRGMQTAVSVDRATAAAKSIRDVVDAVIAEQVPRDVLYTDMLTAASMEPQESMRTAYNFRDLRGFLQNLVMDPHVTSPRVKDAARKADAAIAASVIDHSITDAKRRLKDAHGYTAFLPWKAPSTELRAGYDQLAFNRASDWTRMLDYVFEKHEAAPQTAVAAPAEKLSLVQRLGKEAIHQYKRYVSPYLLVSCRCQPSCSQYTREAIEKHGLVEGMKLGFMRLLTCAGAEGVIDDPVPGCTMQDEQPPPPAIVAPPQVVGKSAVRRTIENSAIRAAALAGYASGGFAGALACLAPGIALGAALGFKAGAGTIDDLNAKLAAKYRHEGVRKFVEVEHLIGNPGAFANRVVQGLTHSRLAARMVGGTVGAVTGAVIGGLGGAYKGFRMGALFGGLWGRNFVKDRFGELPRHPVTEGILQRDYGDQG